MQRKHLPEFTGECVVRGVLALAGSSAVGRSRPAATAMAMIEDRPGEVVVVNPTDPSNLIAGQNDSRVGFNHCGYAYAARGNGRAERRRAAGPGVSCLRRAPRAQRRKKSWLTYRPLASAASMQSL